MKNKPEEKPQNRKIYKNGARTDAPKPSKRDTHVDGALLRVFDGWPRNH